MQSWIYDYHLDFQLFMLPESICKSDPIPFPMLRLPWKCPQLEMVM